MPNMDHFGKYEVIEPIGVGGFGEVFKGFDPDIKRYLAIKTCTSNDKTIRGRFNQEAKIAGNLHHPNITTIYDFGIEGDVPYLAQELLTGQDLDRLITGDEPIPLGDKLRYLRQIAGGLEFAHSRGVVHRDVKPANIHVLKDGTVKILDFGIARLMHEDIGLTKTGTTVGTAAYLAPEQVQGGKVDQRTDIFSFGVLAYELFAGVKPFRGDTFSTVIYSILSEEPKPLREVSPECPPDVAELIESCMAKQAQDRPQDCGQIRERLSERGSTAAQAVGTAAVGTVPITRPEAPMDRRRRTSTAWRWGLGLVVLGAVAFGLYSFFPQAEDAAAEPEPQTMAGPGDPISAEPRSPEPEVDPIPAEEPPPSPVPEEDSSDPVREVAPDREAFGVSRQHRGSVGGPCALAQRKRLRAGVDPPSGRRGGRSGRRRRSGDSPTPVPLRDRGMAVRGAGRQTRRGRVPRGLRETRARGGGRRLGREADAVGLDLDHARLHRREDLALPRARSLPATTGAEAPGRRGPQRRAHAARRRARPRHARRDPRRQVDLRPPPHPPLPLEAECPFFVQPLRVFRDGLFDLLLRDFLELGDRREGGADVGRLVALVRLGAENRAVGFEQQR